MSALWAIIASRPGAPTPSTPAYAWADGAGGNKSVTWTNPNAAPMSVVLEAWDDAAISWVTASPVAIAAGGTASITATKTGTSGSLVTANAVLTCACEGSSVTATATATWYEP